jgi:L-lysine 6-transaminase
MSVHVNEKDVHNTLSKHMLVDGFHLVMDLEKSHGSWIYDASTHKEILDGYQIKETNNYVFIPFRLSVR